ncbi:MAG: hypothetical protein IT318_18270 [Anaerolineales bacterium]|nr:hypothetical protein [Anaerolineales bacterium]
MPRPRSRVRYNVLSPAPARLAPRAVPVVDHWTAGEMFVSLHVEERRRGLAILCGAEAARSSPLTCHLLASRIHEPDLALRAQIGQLLADYFEVRGREYRYPAEVRRVVAEHIRRFGRAEIVALLELLAAARACLAPLRPEAVRRLFERVPGAAAALTQLAGDRDLALNLRMAAIDAIGQVGFTEAGPMLAGLALRLEGRRAGQMTMLFAPADWPEDQALLPALKETLRLLAEDQ